MPDYIQVQMDHDDQCLCCKNIVWNKHVGYRTNRKAHPTYLCPRCHEELRRDPSRALWQLPHFRQIPRLKKKLTSTVEMYNA
jgi:hypothetical protein